MRRRELLFGTTALTAIALTSASRAQEAVVGDITLPLTRERLVSLLSDIGRLVLAVDTLRLNLMLTRPASDMVNVDFGAEDAQYRERKARVRDSRERLIPELANLPDVLPPLSDQLEEAVRRAVTRLLEAGIAAGSALLREMVDNFWAFLFVLERTTADGSGAVASWICGSFPFSVLC